jgi:hypothetical protein
MSDRAEGQGSDAEAQHDLRHHDARWPHGYGVDLEPAVVPMPGDRW